MHREAGAIPGGRHTVTNILQAVTRSTPARRHRALTRARQWPLPTGKWPPLTGETRTQDV